MSTTQQPGQGSAFEVVPVAHTARNEGKASARKDPSHSPATSDRPPIGEDGEGGEVRITVAATPHVRSILKFRADVEPSDLPYTPVARAERSEKERAGGRPRDRRVQLNLPKGYVDKPVSSYMHQCSKRPIPTPMPACLHAYIVCHTMPTKGW